MYSIDKIIQYFSTEDYTISHHDPYSCAISDHNGATVTIRFNQIDIDIYRYLNGFSVTYNYWDHVDTDVLIERIKMVLQQT